ERERRAKSFITEEANRPFNLQCGPVWRATLVRMDDQDHILMLCLHHIVGDRWSTGILVKEFTALYEGMTGGPREELVELSVQYADYAVWQRKWLVEGGVDEQLGYWQRRLAGAPVLELPTDRPRPSVPSHKGAEVLFDLSPNLTHDLKQLSRREGVTLFM